MQEMQARQKKELAVPKQVNTKQETPRPVKRIRKFDFSYKSPFASMLNNQTYLLVGIVGLYVVQQKLL